VVTAKPMLLFISPQFLFPMDAGGKIRTANLLKNLKGGAFHTRILMPAARDDERRWRAEIETLADEASFYSSPSGDRFPELRRIAGFMSALPVSAFCDARASAKKAVAKEIARGPDLVVFDYAQSLVLAPPAVSVPHAVFAHNVETEILERHAKAASGVMRMAWRREANKMRAFERRVCRAADGVIAVSARDAEAFRSKLDARAAFAVPTGVDTDFFPFAPPPEMASPSLVFTGSMDWKANQDGLFWFMEEVWPLIVERRADAAFTVIGKNPPGAMVARARKQGLNWRFTGFVEDIREHAKGAACVIPLRIGGGTRVKAFEAMAMGLPLVSTTLGVEGLDVIDGEHYLRADTPQQFARAALTLFEDAALRSRLAVAARALVERRFTHAAVARAFEQNCLSVLAAAR